MLVRLTDIRPEGLPLKDTISLENINNRMNEGQHNDIIFVSDPSFEILIKPSALGLLLTGKVSANYQQPCCLCLKDLTQFIEVDLNFVIKHGKPGDENDVGIVFYQEEHLNLEDLLQETLILKLNPYLRPACDAEERCLTCGKKTDQLISETSSETTSLGNLLKKAGLR